MLEWTEDSLQVASRQEVLFLDLEAFQTGLPREGGGAGQTGLCCLDLNQSSAFVLSHTEFFHETFCGEEVSTTKDPEADCLVSWPDSSTQ